MSCLTSGKAMVPLLLGAGLVFAVPAFAQAATSAPATAHARYAASSARPDDEVFRFTGDTYPDTTAGLAACEAQGKIFAAEGEGVTDCWLGEPDAGLYGLYMVRTIP
jgi:hypothetical protein